MLVGHSQQRTPRDLRPDPWYGESRASPFVPSCSATDAKHVPTGAPEPGKRMPLMLEGEDIRCPLPPARSNLKITLPLRKASLGLAMEAVGSLAWGFWLGLLLSWTALGGLDVQRTAILYKNLSSLAPEIKECVDACNFISKSTRDQNTNGAIQSQITPHAIVFLPNTDGMEMLLCYEDEGVYVNTYGRIIKDVVLQWGEMPTSVAYICSNQIMGWGKKAIEIRSVEKGHLDGVFMHKRAQRLKFLCERNDKVFFASVRSGGSSQVYFMTLNRNCIMNWGGEALGEGPLPLGQARRGVSAGLELEGGRLLPSPRERGQLCCPFEGGGRISFLPCLDTAG
ncbi:Misshapen-like kinase 1 [Crotalus adamanteus]|uniref:non-specific serine/threonine protein kinase n=1 Tax=Crotalus adamanteus TaxID=8729 RepID=A0AAW1BA41_CROAD